MRFVAQSLGAVVGYDSHAQLVTIVLRAAGIGTRVVALTPSEGAAVSSAYPTISASLAAANAGRGEVSLVLDGEDVTRPGNVRRRDDHLYPARRALERTAHGQCFPDERSPTIPFRSNGRSTRRSARCPKTARRHSPISITVFTRTEARFIPVSRFTSRCSRRPAARRGCSFCNLGYEYPLWNGGYGGTYEADIPAPLGYWIPSCPVTAVYTAWNGAQTYVPIPLIIGVYTQPSHDRHHHHSTATPAPRGIEPMPRRLEPTPAPTPRPAPLPSVRLRLRPRQFRAPGRTPCARCIRRRRTSAIRVRAKRPSEPRRSLRSSPNCLRTARGRRCTHRHLPAIARAAFVSAPPCARRRWR